MASATAIEISLATERMGAEVIFGLATLPSNLVRSGSVTVDEHEAWRVQPEANAIAAVRGNAELKTPLRFVRFEPFVLPKKSLTGDSTERVDTRVLQVIYRLEREDLRLFVGQQMDVFIETPGLPEGAQNATRRYQ